MADRLYAVSNAEELTMVRASSQAQALAHVARNQFTVKIATAMDVVEYMEAGGKVETAQSAAQAAQVEAPAEE